MESSKLIKDKTDEELEVLWNRIKSSWKEEEIQERIKHGPRQNEPFDTMVVEVHAEMVLRKLLPPAP